jgi:hypothetical protein
MTAAIRPILGHRKLRSTLRAAFVPEERPENATKPPA